MTPEDTLKQQEWYILKKIQEEAILSGNTFFVRETAPFEIKEENNVPVPDYRRQIKILKKLAKEGAIAFLSIGPMLSYFNEESKLSEGRLGEIEIKILRPKFDEVYEEYEIKTKNLGDQNRKGKKRVTLPSFPRTEWVNASISFLDDRSVLLCNKKVKDTKPSSFEGLGCDDTRSSPAKPDENWNFLLKLAQNMGQTKPIGKADRERQTKQKQKVTDILRKIFQNDTDPFETEKGGVYRAKFEITYASYTEGAIAKKDKFFDLNDTRTKMTESTQENTEYDLKDKGDEFSE